MKKFTGVLVCLAATLVLAHCEGGVSSGKTVVSINGKKITEGDLEFLGTINPSIKGQIASPFGRKHIVDNLVEQELLYQASTKKGLQNDPKVKAKIDLYRRVIIAQALMENELETAAKKYYDTNVQEFEQLKMSQIMIAYATPEDLKKESGKKKAAQPKKRTEAEALQVAQALRARLDKGEDFAAIAKEVSEDPMSKARGGDMGPISRKDEKLERRGMSTLVEKAFELKVGELAGPIKTDKGYHIITVTAPAEQKTFEEVKALITAKQRNQARETLMADLKKNAKIKYPEEKKQEKPGEVAKPGEAPAAEQPAEQQAVEPGATPATPAAPATNLTAPAGIPIATQPTETPKKN